MTVRGNSDRAVNPGFVVQAKFIFVASLVASIAFGLLVYKVTRKPVVLQGDPPSSVKALLFVARVAAYVGVACLGPITAIMYSYRFHVSPEELIGTRFMGLSHVAFNRGDIAEAKLHERRNGRRVLKVKLRTGKRIAVDSYASNFERLVAFVGAQKA
jgi:hypothetical protein